MWLGWSVTLACGIFLEHQREIAIISWIVLPQWTTALASGRNWAWRVGQLVCWPVCWFVIHTRLLPAGSWRDSQQADTGLASIEEVQAIAYKERLLFSWRRKAPPQQGGRLCHLRLFQFCSQYKFKWVEKFIFGVFVSGTLGVFSLWKEIPLLQLKTILNITVINGWQED